MYRPKLMLHAGASEANLMQVANVKTPEATDTWCPVPHLSFINEIKAALVTKGLTVTDESYALWGNSGERLFGLFAIQNGTQHDDYGMVIGLRNSHDKTFPASAAIGSQVFICDNLALSGEIKFSRKHTKFILRDLQGIVMLTMGRLLRLRGWQDQRIAAYKATEIGQVEAYHAMVRAVEMGILPPTLLKRLLHEWKWPKHEEFKADTVWSLFNGFTEVLKGAPTELQSRTIKLHGLMDAVARVEAPPALRDVTEEDVLDMGAAVAQETEDAELVEA